MPAAAALDSRRAAICFVTAALTVVLAMGFSSTHAVAQQNAAETATGASSGSAWHAEGTSKGKSWSVYATPYLWASGIKGAVGTGNQTANVNMSFGKVLEHVDGAFMLPTEAWYGRFGLGAEVIFTSISNTEATPGPQFSSAKVQVGQFITEIAPRYRVLDRKNVTLDALGGLRVWSLKHTLTLGSGPAPGGDVNLNESWSDPYLGARTFVTLAKSWLVQLRADVGGFGVGSKSSWQAVGLIDYRFNERATVRAGYRQLDVNYQRNSFLYDVGLGGAFLGATFAF